MEECLPRGRSVGQRSGTFSMNVWIVTAPPIVKNLAPSSSCVNNSFKLLYFEMLKTFEFERDVNGDWHPVVGKKPVPPLIISESFTGIYKAISRPDILYLYIYLWYEIAFESVACIFWDILKKVGIIVLVIILLIRNTLAFKSYQMNAYFLSTTQLF